IELAKADRRLQITMDKLDAEPLWLNTPTGTLDLATGRIWAPRFGDLLTMATRVGYDPDATCPTWERFLARVLPDPEVRAFFQRSVGYSLTGLTIEQVMWFLYGRGRNGKSTALNALAHPLGDYAGSTQASSLMIKQHGDDKRNDIAVLR